MIEVTSWLLAQVSVLGSLLFKKLCFGATFGPAIELLLATPAGVRAQLWYYKKVLCKPDDYTVTKALDTQMASIVMLLEIPLRFMCACTCASSVCVLCCTCCCLPVLQCATKVWLKAIDKVPLGIAWAWLRTCGLALLRSKSTRLLASDTGPAANSNVHSSCREITMAPVVAATGTRDEDVWWCGHRT